MLIAIQRGFVSTLPWSPLAFAMAISTTLVPGADWADAVGPCLVSGLLLAGIGWALDTLFKPRLSAPAPPRAEPDGAWSERLRPLLALLGVLVVAVGFLMTSSLDKVAARHPATRFAIIDSVVDQPNVASLVFREHEGSYLVGALAARKSKSGVIGIVKGLDVPLLMKFEHGYRQGFDAERAHLGLPRGRVLSMVAGSFADPVRGKEWM